MASLCEGGNEPASSLKAICIIGRVLLYTVRYVPLQQNDGAAADKEQTGLLEAVAARERVQDMLAYSSCILSRRYAQYGNNVSVEGVGVEGKFGRVSTEFKAKTNPFPSNSTESYPAFARIGLRENPGENLNQITFPDRDSNPGHLVSRPDVLTVTPQYKLQTFKVLTKEDGWIRGATAREGPRPTSRLLASRPHTEAEVDDHPTRMEVSCGQHDDPPTVIAGIRNRISLPILLEDENLLTLMAYDEDLSAKFIFSEETTFQVNGIVNKQNVRIWGSENPHFILEAERDSSKVNLFCAVSKRKVYGQFLFQENIGIGMSYLDMLTDIIEDEEAVSKDEKGFSILSEKVELALKEMKNLKVTGVDGIPIELVKSFGENKNQILSLCNEIYEKGEWPEDFLETVLIPIPKKHNAEKCNEFSLSV
ncbi:hypothetical protein ANN_14500 [Periplaneta americana]|uniref:Uncharacterized protein n=1 Tax=Periplaneta americana TaxID=6978 RepID=A0ABQ8SWG1_PERAM|nr:hypothetical protein ANN_14500 [Periplaneta americana]